VVIVDVSATGNVVGDPRREGDAMGERVNIGRGYGAWGGLALALIWLFAAAPAMALNINAPSQPFDIGNVAIGPTARESALIGISGRGTADSDPASLASHAGEVSDKADTTQSIYCKKKGGVVWLAADLLSSIAQKPNDSYQIEAMRCP
jgi:hypothetical protein